MSMELLGAKLRRYLANFSEALSTLLAYSAEAVASAAKAGRQGYGGFCLTFILAASCEVFGEGE